MASRRVSIVLNSIRSRYQFNLKSSLSTVNNNPKSSELYVVDKKKDGGAVLDPLSPIHTAQRPYIEELKPPVKRSFNLAAYVNTSKTLQELVKLGVSLYDIENTNMKAAQHLIGLDFEKDCVNHIKFLVDNGLKEKNLGHFVSEFPMIFSQKLDDLQGRIDYFVSKGFTRKSIGIMLNRSSIILSLTTKVMDNKLGILQVEFNLPAPILRKMVEMHPTVIALPVGQHRLIRFTLQDEFGFRIDEIHEILAAQPKLMDILRPVLIERLDLIHNKIGFSHSTIVKYPKLITGPRFDINNRFLYLQKLKRNQFNPKEPLYVPPPALYSIDDEEFCTKYSKTDLDDYKLFLKSC